jgi:hypothetical protein
LLVVNAFGLGRTRAERLAVALGVAQPDQIVPAPGPHPFHAILMQLFLPVGLSPSCQNLLGFDQEETVLVGEFTHVFPVDCLF